MGSPMTLDHRGILTSCPSCGATNRLPYRTLGRAARCGRCRTALPPPASPIEMTAPDIFDALISSTDLPVVVDFWAPWCGPCRVMAPEVAKAAHQMAGRAIVVKVNTEAEPTLAARFAVRSIPTLAVFHHGHETDRLVGARPAAEIEALMDRTARSPR